MLKSISSFRKSCNNRCAGTFRVPDNYGQHRAAGLRLRSLALQNRRSERLTKGSGTASSVLDPLAIRTELPFSLDVSQTFTSLIEQF